MANNQPILKEKDKPKAEKKRSVSWLKEKLDEVFSLWVRLSAADHRGYVTCVTCGKQAHYKDKMQAGHFVSRNQLATRYEPRNVHVQCVGCNYFGKGRVVEHADYIARTYGSDTITELYREAQKIVKDFPYEKKIQEYTEEVNKLLKIC